MARSAYSARFHWRSPGTGRGNWSDCPRQPNPVPPSKLLDLDGQRLEVRFFECHLPHAKQDFVISLAGLSGTALGAENGGSDFASTDHGSNLIDSLLAAQTTGSLHDLARYKITFRATNDSIRFR